MRTARLSFLFEPDVALAASDDASAYLAFGNAACRAKLLAHCRAAPKKAAELADRMLLGQALDALAFQSATVIASAVAVLALAGESAKPRLTTLVKKGPPAAGLHARMALASLGGAEDVPKKARAALDALTSQDAKKRALAAAGVANLAVPVSLEPLRKALDDAQPAVRLEAARALGRLGDGAAFEPLMAKLVKRPKSPPASARGAAPQEVADAVAAYDGLVRLGDVRAIPEIVALAGDGRWAGWIAKAAESSPIDALVSLQPLGIVGIAERALADKYVLDAAMYVPQMSNEGCIEAARRLLEMWVASGAAAQRAKREGVRERLGERL